MALRAAVPDEDALIERWVEPPTRRPTPADARLHGYGISVWALIEYLRLVDGDVQQVAGEYAVPPEAVRAAIAYYRRHREAVDARIALNAA